jgi:hypothetical protein
VAVLVGTIVGLGTVGGWHVVQVKDVVLVLVSTVPLSGFGTVGAAGPDP